jgi:hypothetical protein
MEILHSLNPEEGMNYLAEFYAEEAGNYFLAADKESLLEVQTIRNL